MTQRRSSCWVCKRMTRHEKYDSLMARIMLPENYERRNPQIFSDTDNIIAECLADMKKYVALCDAENKMISVFEEKQFDCNYDKVVSLLDELGWK